MFVFTEKFPNYSSEGLKGKAELTLDDVSVVHLNQLLFIWN